MKVNYWVGIFLEETNYEIDVDILILIFIKRFGYCIGEYTQLYWNK